MANKKYTDFPAGTYNTSKIFLQADAVTGELEKVNLPTVPAGQTPYTLKTFLGPITSAGGGTNSVCTFTIPANTLVNDGDRLLITIVFKTTGSDNKTLKPKINGYNASNTTSTSAASQSYQWTIMKSGNTQASNFVVGFANANIALMSTSLAGVYLWNADQVFTIDLTSTTAGSITIYSVSVDVIPKEN